MPDQIVSPVWFDCHYWTQKVLSILAQSPSHREDPADSRPENEESHWKIIPQVTERNRNGPTY
jgi:hypothetical protein